MLIYDFAYLFVPKSHAVLKRVLSETKLSRIYLPLKFSKAIQEVSILLRHDKGRWVYTPLRTDEKLNLFNSFIAQT